jgi:hypothetical protein
VTDQGPHAITIHAKLVARFREKALAYSSVANCLRRLHCGEDIFEPGIHSGKSSEGFGDFKILTERAVFSFHDMQTLAGSFVVKYLQWVLHRFDDVIKTARMTTAESLLKNLRQVRHRGWPYLLAGDESRFFYATDYERMSLPEGVRPQSRPRTMISTAKVMGSILWSPLGLAVIPALPPRTKFTASYCCSDIIPKIIERLSFNLANSPGQAMLHIDNTTRTEPENQSHV